MDFQQAEVLASEWIQAWNRRDSEADASPCSENVQFQSPLIVHLLGEPSGIVSGKQNLKEYFRKALEAFPGESGIELVGVYQGVSSKLVHFQAKGRRAIEVMERAGKDPSRLDPVPTVIVWRSRPSAKHWGLR